MTNAEFDLAEHFVLYTHKHCFITGKAGTGKTTLLKKIVERTAKNSVVVAPTGVAAINAGGVTIHSMFGLPLTCFVPSDDFVDLNLATNRRRLQYEHMHFRKEKLRVIREMDTLIIDEVSMVRCDILDAIDFVMRTARRNQQPFGGVQVVLFGDMHQLPPVIKEPEWDILRNYYQGPYFFDSKVWPQLDAAQIELQKIYRQSDARFLELLNNVRNRQMNDSDFEKLRERYNPEFKATESGYILLSTHNYKADTVNGTELAKLPGSIHTFEAQIEGEFPEHMYPCDRVLKLKTGAQVMFIRNDTEGSSYYNGKLAVVKRIDGTGIRVTFNDSGQDYVLHRESWDNIDYRLEPESAKVVRNELGTFSQFPLRLAWAITIHKSQGLTFDKVIIDAGRSFAAGQVYVALSRCRSLEGIVLHSLIAPGALRDDQRIGDFSAAHHPTEALVKMYEREKAQYANRLLLRLFYFSDLSQQMDDWLDLINKKDLPEKESAIALHEQINGRLKNIDETAIKFQRQLQRIFDGIAARQVAATVLNERCAKAIAYFTDQIGEGIVKPLRAHINGLAYRKKMKRYLTQTQLIEDICWRKIDQLYQGRFLDEALYTGEIIHARNKVVQVISSATKPSKGKGGTFKDTLDLFRKGKTVAEIASIRGLRIGTIKTHLIRWIEDGQIALQDVLPADMINEVILYMDQNRGSGLSEVRSGLGNKYEYDDIRMIMTHVLAEKPKTKTVQLAKSAIVPAKSAQ